LQLAQIYNFPPGDGAGQKIAIVELGGGFILSEIQTYFTNLGITTAPKVTSVLVGAGRNNPSDTNASVEVILDIEIIAAIVPQADIRVYFATNSDSGFFSAINQAINDGCTVISISWGAAETFWSTTTLNSFNNLFSSAVAKGVSIYSSSGDNGSSDGSAGLNVDFPGSCPYGVSCGGTRLVASGNTITSETVWNNNSTTSATGGGISKIFPTPSYQANLTIQLNGKRGCPDISANADPQTGYIVYGQGQSMVVGGTSCVSPLFSALTARINQNLGKNIGLIHPKLYEFGSTVCRDITAGNNGGYTAISGYDLTTGWGSPDGVKLLNLFKGEIPIPPVLPVPPILPVPPVLPIADFLVNKVSGTVPLTVNFTNSSTNATSFLWDFGNGQTSTLLNPSITYNSVGIYTVSLTGSNSNASNTIIKTNLITVSPVPVPTPVADFLANKVSGTVPLTVNFTNTSTNSTSFLWDFGNGQSSTLQNPSITYNTAGTYTVTLIATGEGGNNTIIKTNLITISPAPVTPPPVSSFSLGNISVSFKNTSTGATSYKWNFGDGIISTVASPTHIYSKPGTYIVTLTSKSAAGSTIFSKTITLQ
jgi:PKD repeat protein